MAIEAVGAIAERDAAFRIAQLLQLLRSGCGSDVDDVGESSVQFPRQPDMQVHQAQWCGDAGAHELAVLHARAPLDQLGDDPHARRRMILESGSWLPVE